MHKVRDSMDSYASLIKFGRISSTLRQYVKKLFEDQHPITMTTQGSMPLIRWCIMPPIWKLWPSNLSNPSSSQITLHLSMNHAFVMGAQPPSVVCHAKSGASSGISGLDTRWCSKAVMGLDRSRQSMR